MVEVLVRELDGVVEVAVVGEDDGVEELVELEVDEADEDDEADEPDAVEVEDGEVLDELQVV